MIPASSTFSCCGPLVGSASLRVAELYEAFRRPVQSAIACFTKATLRSRPPFAPNQEFPLELSEARVPLGRNAAYVLRFAQRYRVAQRDGREWEVQTTAYSYWLLDRAGHELLLYQWIPAGLSPVTTPHLHVGALAHPHVSALVQAQAPLAPLTRAHLPTGFISLTDILRMAVADLGVEPLERNPRSVAGRLAAADAALRASFVWQMSR